MSKTAGAPIDYTCERSERLFNRGARDSAPVADG